MIFELVCVVVFNDGMVAFDFIMSQIQTIQTKTASCQIWQLAAVKKL